MAFKAFALLTRAEGPRGTWADPFGRTAERRAERALRDEYLTTIEGLCARVDASNLETVIAIAKLPQDIRGYEPVEETAMAGATKHRANLLAMLADGPVDLTV